MAMAKAELPFFATETVLMQAVAAGGERQALHESIRVHAFEAARRIKEGDGTNDLLERIAGDEAFAAVRDELPTLTDPARFIGRAPEQVDAFLTDVVTPAVGEATDDDAAAFEVRV